MSSGVVSVGARTAVGLDARQTAFLLRAGFPAMSEAPLAAASGEAITMALVPTIDPTLVGAERLAVLGRAPFEEAIAPIRDLAASVRVAIDEGCPDAPLATRLVSTALQRAMPNATVEVAARGEAAFATWLPEALSALASRQSSVVVLGGIHSDYDPVTIATLEASGRLFSPDNLDSRIVGEAAAFVVLMRDTDAPKYALSPLARVLGVGGGKERATPFNDESAYEAFGLTAAVREASAPLARAGRTAGWMLTDLTGEMRRLHEWETVFTRAHKVLGRPYVIESPAQRIGYLGAAAIPLFMTMAASAWRYRFAPSKTALAFAGNDLGDRAAVVLEEGLKCLRGVEATVMRHGMGARLRSFEGVRGPVRSAG